MVQRWGMGLGLPTRAVSTGGKYIYNDDQETPNTQKAVFDYGGKPWSVEGGVGVGLNAASEHLVFKLILQRDLH